MPADSRPLRADAIRNKALILEAAAELFAREGPDVALDEIARRAGVGAGTVHRHFPNKRSLLASTLAVELERRIAQGSELLESDADGQGLFTLLEALLQDGRRNRALKQALGDVAGALHESAPELPKRLDQVLRGLLRRSIDRRAVRSDVDLTDVKAVLVGALAAQDLAGRGRISHTQSLILDALRPRARVRASSPPRDRNAED